MDYNEYTMSWLIKERHAELLAAARRDAAARRAGGAWRPLRTALGTALIRVGARLLREEYAASQAS